MLAIRRAKDRFHTRIDWLDSHHTFSFGDHYDPRHMGFGALRVINDDRVAPASGFPTHPHRDMEILTWVLEGSLEHKDSMGTGSRVGPGEIQRMSAGTGVRHSEWNPSETEPLHLLQIWVIPEREHLPPGYEQRKFEPSELADRLRVIASRDGRDGSVSLNQDATLLATRIGAGKSVAHALAAGRSAWIHVARGTARVNGTELGAGDGAALGPDGARAIEISGAGDGAEVLVFDLPNEHVGAAR